MTSTKMPHGAWDCHTHIYGPFDRFPLPATAAYTPDAAPFTALQALHERLGIAQGVLVQAAPYGTDHAAILEAIARNYLAVTDRNRDDMIGTAAARLAQGSALAGDPKLSRDLKLPDGTVVAAAGATFSPPVTIMSLVRSTMYQKPSSSSRATSPVCIQPSSRKVSAVSSGRFQ